MTVKTVYIISFTVVVLVPLIMAFFIYHFSARSIDAQTKDTNNAYLELTTNTIDELLDGMTTARRGLLLNRPYDAIRLYRPALSREQRYNLYSFVSTDLKSIFSTDDAELKSIYLVNSDLFLFVDTYATSERARQIRYSGIHWTDDQFAILRGDNGALQYLSVDTQAGEALACVMPISRGYHRFDGNIIFIFPKQTFINRLQQADWNGEGVFAIADGDNNILLSTEDIDIPQDVVENLTVGEQVISLAGEDVLCLMKGSRNANLRCLYIAPYRVIYRQLSGVRTAFMIAVLLCLAATAVIISYAVHRNYVPISRIMEQIPDSGVHENEMDVIYSALERNRLERSNLEQELAANRQLLARNFLARLLTGGIAPSAYAWRRMESYDMPLAAERYAVAAVCAPEFYNDTEEANIARNAMEVFEKYVKTRIPGLSLYETSDHTAEYLLLGFGRDEWDGVEAGIRSAIWQISETYRLRLTVAVSLPSARPEDIPTLYHQASVALKYAQMQQDVDFVQYPRQENDIHLFPAQMEAQLIQTVREGDAAGAQRILRDYIDGAEKNISIAARQCMRFDLIAICFRVYANADRILTRDMWGGAHAAQELMEETNLERLEALVMAQIGALCRAMGDRQRAGKGNLASRIQDYVAAHWSEDSLSVASVAAAFDLNSSYVSRLFKEEQGIGLLTYINKYRVERACELLKSDAQTVAQVAQQCGFVSDSALIRTFKQYTGVTPGQYREMQHA